MKRASLIAVPFLLMVACDGDKPPTAPTATTPIVLSLASVSVSLSPVVQKIPPGETAQLIATARYSDGSTKDVTSQAGWTSSQRNVAVVSAGAVTGVALGRTAIRATFERWSASLNIVIEPDGTFIVKGRVTEPGVLGVGGATVEPTSGPPNQVTTNYAGFYELFGVGGTSTVLIRKTGYYDQTRTLTMSADQSVDVMLSPRVPPAGLAGTYRATFTASGSCATLLGELKTRTYTARIDQDAARLIITLSDAPFVNNGAGGLRNRFEGRVFADSVTLELGDDYYIFYYGATVEELLPDGRVIGIWGTITAPVASQSISGTLAGGFALKTGTRYTSCSAADNQVVFTRQ